MKRFYIAAAIIGTIAPYATCFGYLASVPASSDAMSLAWANPIAAATLVDFAISCLAFWPFLLVESRRPGMRHRWIFIPANVLIGLSFALPLFLYSRERHLEARAQSDNAKSLQP